MAGAPGRGRESPRPTPPRFVRCDDQTWRCSDYRLVCCRPYGDSVITNRSAPHARVTPVLTVADVREAVAWYADVFGFVEHVRIGEAHRSQLGLPDGPAAELVVVEVRPGLRTPGQVTSHQVMLKVIDVAAVLERAITRGAELIDSPHDWEYGERQAAVTDPFGHQWILNQTLTDVAPEQWGGQTVTPRPPSR